MLFFSLPRWNRVVLIRCEVNWRPKLGRWPPLEVRGLRFDVPRRDSGKAADAFYAAPASWRGKASRLTTEHPRVSRASSFVM